MAKESSQTPVDAIRQRMALNALRLYNWIALEGGFTVSKRKEMTRQKFTNIIAYLRPSPTLTAIMGRLYDDVQGIANLPHCGDAPAREDSYGGLTPGQRKMGLRSTKYVDGPEANTDWD